MGDLSPHFDTSEFRCHHCGRVSVAEELVEALERCRRIISRPIPIVSGFRCEQHNRMVGGAPRSQHLYGRAADLPRGLVTVRQATDAGFRGIGHRGSWVVHVDVRPGRVVVFVD